MQFNNYGIVTNRMERNWVDMIYFDHLEVNQVCNLVYNWWASNWEIFISYFMFSLISHFKNIIYCINTDYLHLINELYSGGMTL